MYWILIVISQTGTILSRTIKFVTGAPYNHSSIATVEGKNQEGDLSSKFELDTMFSFGRKYPNIPFIGGFVTEHIDSGTFAKFKGTICKVIAIPVDKDIYDRAKKCIDEMLSNQDEYKYNILGLVYALFDKKRQSKKHFYCSEFVRYVLAYAGLDCSGVSYYSPRPVNFVAEEWVKKLGAQIIYEGPLCDYPFYKKTEKEESEEKSQRVLKRVLNPFQRSV